MQGAPQVLLVLYAGRTVLRWRGNCCQASKKEVTDMVVEERHITATWGGYHVRLESQDAGSGGSSKDAPDKDSGSSKTTGAGEGGETQPVQKPSQAEGDRATIDADIRQKEREGKL